MNFLEVKQLCSIEELKTHRLLTREQAAVYLGGICKANLSKIVRSPDFPALVRIGRRVFVNREKLDEWIDSKTGV